ncbi:P-loop containing nucleoside triphosphate hydrolase protein [Dissophora ornata]|nr:P-loop containing nucleoside triphosphate hydrolase protein [Dissophora ornata]
MPVLPPVNVFYGGGHHRDDSLRTQDLNTEWMGTIPSPREIVKYLDEYVIGQEKAKKILSVAVYNHFSRVKENIRQQQFQEPLGALQNASTPTLPLMHQPSPLPPFTPLPSSSSASVFYGATGQLPGNNPISRDPTTDSFSSSPGSGTMASQTSVEMQPWSNSRSMNDGQQPSHNTFNSPPSAISELTAAKGPHTIFDKSNVLLLGPTGSGKTLLARTLAKILNVPFSMSDATPFTQAGYVGEDVETVIHRLLQSADYNIKRAECGIIFIDEIDKISKRPDAMSISKDVSGEGVQQALLRMLEGTVVHIAEKNGPAPGSGPASGPGWNLPTPSIRKGGSPGIGSGGPGAKGEIYSVDTSNILFILSGAFIGLEKIVMDRVSKGSMGFGALVSPPSSELGASKGDSAHVSRLLNQVDPTDLIKFGLIPEFIGRLPVVASVNQLDEDSLIRILTEPRNSLVRQYQGLFKLTDVKIRFSRPALQAIAMQAIEKQTGARGLRRIMEMLLLDVMYEAPGSTIRHVVVDKDVALGTKSALCFSEGADDAADAALSEDERD